MDGPWVTPVSWLETAKSECCSSHVQSNESARNERNPNGIQRTRPMPSRDCSRMILCAETDVARIQLKLFAWPERSSFPQLAKLSWRHRTMCLAITVRVKCTPRISNEISPSSYDQVHLQSYGKACMMPWMILTTNRCGWCKLGSSFQLLCVNKVKQVLVRTAGFKRTMQVVVYRILEPLRTCLEFQKVDSWFWISRQIIILCTSIRTISTDMIGFGHAFTTSDKSLVSTVTYELHFCTSWSHEIICSEFQRNRIGTWRNQSKPLYMNWPEMAWHNTTIDLAEWISIFVQSRYNGTVESGKDVGVHDWSLHNGSVHKILQMARVFLIWTVLLIWILIH